MQLHRMLHLAVRLSVSFAVLDVARLIVAKITTENTSQITIDLWLSKVHTKLGKTAQSTW